MNSAKYIERENTVYKKYKTSEKRQDEKQI